MSETLLLREQNEGICVLTLNRANAYNALSLELMTALIDQLRLAADDEDVRVVLLKGLGRGFCAGHDLKEVTSCQDEAHHQQTFSLCSELMQAIVNFPVPVIAQVSGIATAAGCQLVASCDLAICDDKARFATPGVNIGLFCSTPMVALTRSLQPKHALEMLYMGELLGAERAEQIGLVNWVVAEDQLEQQAMAKAEVIASKSRATLALGKRAYHQQKGMLLEDAYQHCSQVMVDNLKLDDAKEGINAFIEKRSPQWRHR